jgi:DNA-binding GntR family transcriptional regulator
MRRDGSLRFQGKRDVIAQRLREEIVRGELAVGVRLRQEEIASRYGVSPTPVREALRVLETQGFVTHESHRGVTVADFGGSFEQVYLLREALESLATELSVRRMTPERAAELVRVVERLEDAGRRGDETGRHDAHAEFHHLLYGGSEFPALLDLIAIVWSRYPWDELLTLPGLSTLSDHCAIADRAVAGDADGAAEELRRHLHRVRDLVGATLKERSAKTSPDAGRS